MTECEEISDKLIDYINRKLTAGENNAVITHLAGCKNCREEVAFLIKVGKTERSKMNPVLEDIYNHAFDKISDNAFEYNSLSIWDAINYPMKAFKQTVKLAMQEI